jgi:hypothetical protein
LTQHPKQENMLKIIVSTYMDPIEGWVFEKRSYDYLKFMAPQTFPKRNNPECKNPDHKNPNLLSGIFVIIPNVKIPKMPFTTHPALLLGEGLYWQIILT